LIEADNQKATLRIICLETKTWIPRHTIYRRIFGFSYLKIC